MGSIVVSTANMMMIPDKKIGVIMMGNSGGMSYAPVAESVLAILLGEDPDEVIPTHGVEDRMQRLVGSYETYEGIQTVEIIEQSGMLYLKYEESLTPLIPEDTSYQDSAFYTLSNGRKNPIDVRVDIDGAVTMLIGRYVYRRKD